VSLLFFIGVAIRMAVAQETLQYVFKLHAGFLQSYEVDDQKRMLNSSQIIMEAEAKTR